MYNINPCFFLSATLILCNSVSFVQADQYTVINDVGEEIPEFVITPKDGPNPWTHLALRNSPSQFQFAIVTDNTGGSRPGVFAEAVTKLNLLQPEFVVSVGDLIEGYTVDRARVTREWDDFEGLVDGLEMPFFYLPGNHDYSNPVMAEIWGERFGADYYHFVYRDVLFVMLNSNDGRANHVVSEKQLDWFKEVLDANPDPKWTLVFLHAPLWDRESKSRWPQMEAMLASRRHTVFAGHHHKYVKSVRNGSNYYTLATTGGVSLLRGTDFGEFDHVMWVTMTDEGPKLANLLLEGIWEDDVRTEEIRDLQKQVVDNGSLFPQPILFRGRVFEKGKSAFRMSNKSDFPADIELRLSQTADVRYHGRYRQTITVPPHGEEMVEFEFENVSGAVLSGAIAEVDWAIGFQHLGGKNKFKGTETVALMRELPIPVATQIAVDGDLGDWEELPFVFENEENISGRVENWKGRQDSHFQFGVAADENYLYVGVDVWDDAIYTNEDEGPWPWVQDWVSIRIDPRPKTIRTINRWWWQPGHPAFVLVPYGSAEETRADRPSRLPQGSKYAAVLNNRGYAAEIAIPVSFLDEQAGGRWDGVRLNVSVADRDPGEDGRAKLWWQPFWRDSRSLSGSGSFYRP